MPVLTVSVEEVCRVARLDPADETAFTDARDAILVEQDAVEATLRPDALADAGLAPLLTSLVAKALAAEVLALRAREAGATGAFQGAGLIVGREPDHAAALRAEADAALLPYRRRVASAHAPVGPSPASRASQSRRFGAEPPGGEEGASVPA